MRVTRVIAAVAWFLCISSATSPAAEVMFTAKPAVKKDGEKTVITFAVSGPTDVAVFIEDAKGKIVCHLAAGLLGKNPPEPLKANSLEQTLVWDGKDDDGKVAQGGPFHVRVGLGLKVDPAGTAFMDKSGANALTSVLGLTTGPDGRLYVLDDRSGYYVFPGYSVHVFRRDGSYEKTIKPFGPHLPLERLKDTGAFVNDRGYLNPLIRNGQEISPYPFADHPTVQMAVAGGQLWQTVVTPTGGGYLRHRSPRLAAIDLDGGIPNEAYAGPLLGPAKDGWTLGAMYLAVSSDKQHLFLSGFGSPAEQVPAVSQPFLVRVTMADRGPGELVFGDRKQAEKDNAHLNSPRGLATDGKGHLLICDHGNDRILVLHEKDMSFAGTISVEGPEWVGCDPKSGTVYVCGKESVIKFSGWKDAKELYRLNLAFQKKGSFGAYNWSFQRSFALDASAAPPVLWLGLRKVHGMKEYAPLLRCEDNGAKFTDPVPVDYYSPPLMRGLTTDPHRREVGCQVDGTLVILDEESGKTRKVPGVISSGGINRLGPDGAIYSNAHALGIRRWDRDGKLKPFDTTDEKTGPNAGVLPGKAGSSGTTFWERDFSIDRKNDIYTTVRGAVYHGLRHVSVFDQDGKVKRTAIWGVTDGVLGPRVDPKGNLYILESIKPVGEPYPVEFQKHLADPKVQHWYDWMYGSALKFPPRGGNLWLKAPSAEDKPAAEPVPLPDTVAKTKVYALRRKDDNFVQGALWLTPGVANGGDMSGRGTDFCHCTSTDFDVDDFGRMFAPDILRHRVTVLDTNGNVLLHFGAYGNQDYCGPESHVIDPASKLLRPRKVDDPKDLKSPFAEPAIAFNRIIGLAVTNRYVYVADVANRRVLRCQLNYAAENVVPIAP